MTSRIRYIVDIQKGIAQHSVRLVHVTASDDTYSLFTRNIFNMYLIKHDSEVADLERDIYFILLKSGLIDEHCRLLRRLVCYWYILLLEYNSAL